MSTISRHGQLRRLGWNNLGLVFGYRLPSFEGKACICTHFWWVSDPFLVGVTFNLNTPRSQIPSMWKKSLIIPLSTPQSSGSLAAECHKDRYWGHTCSISTYPMPLFHPRALKLNHMQMVLQFTAQAVKPKIEERNSMNIFSGRFLQWPQIEARGRRNTSRM